jgi:ferric-dicitrate binding protein FerR (iron transport regulator)
MPKNRNIESQLTNYLAGECTPAEQLEIEVLIQSDSETKAVYNGLKQVWDNAVPQFENEVYNVDSAWEHVGKHIDAKPLGAIKHNIAQKPVLRFIKFAASIAAALILSFTVYQVYNNTSGATKVFASGKAVSSALQLADGSKLFLNAGSEVKYPEKFGSHGREVYFWGEAFFEIAPDPARPFVIETGDARIKVLGTSFNVKAYPETGITEVVVNSGTVLFYHVDNNDAILGQVILKKGDKGIYDRTTHKLAKIANDDLNFMSWKTGILVFNETPLDEVMKVVGNKYGVTFHTDNQRLSSLKLTATFDNESLDSVLEVLGLVHKLQFTHNGKDYLVK